MGNMIVSENKIKNRYYNLVIDGEIVEEMLSPRMANILRNEYRDEGFAVDKIEAFTVTNRMEIVGDNTVKSREMVYPRKKFNTPEVTEQKQKINRLTMRTKNELLAAKKNRQSTSVRYTSYGRERNSLLHQDYLRALRKNGFRVYNLVTDEVWIGFQKEIAEKIYNYLNHGGDKANLDIKFLGSK